MGARYLIPGEYGRLDREVPLGGVAHALHRLACGFVIDEADWPKATIEALARRNGEHVCPAPGVAVYVHMSIRYPKGGPVEGLRWF